MARTGIALGTNLGDRTANLRAALAALCGISTQRPRVAPLFETEPQGCPDGSPSFLNTVVEIDWTGTPAELLEATHAIEQRLGRVTSPVPNAPRLIDIDILYCGHTAVDTPGLILPHPRMAVRSFVLMPLAVMCPDFRPVHGGPSVRDMLGTLPPEPSPPRLVRDRDWADGSG